MADNYNSDSDKVVFAKDGNNVEDYHLYFDVDGFLKRFEVEKAMHETKAHLMESLHEIFKEGKYKGDKLLDICSGPTVYSVLSASKYFSKTYLTDYTLQSRQALQKWLARDQTAFDWSPYFKLVADFEGESSAADIEERVRGRIAGILPCDLTQEAPLGAAQDAVTPADAVMSFLTVDAIAKDYSDLVSCLRRLNRLLNHGGFLCLVGYQTASEYYAGNYFWCSQYSEDDVVRALKEVGFIGIHFRDIVSPPNRYNNCSDCYIVTSTKE